MTKGKKIFMIILAFSVVILILFLGYKKNSSPGQANKQATESQGVGYVTINNTQVLSKYLLDRQIAGVQQALNDYIQNNLDKTIRTATINGAPSQNADGTLMITIITSEPEKTFQATIDQNTYFNKLIIKVPSSGFEETVKVY